MGRPKVPDALRLSVKVTVPMTQSDWDEVEASSTAKGVTPAELIRARIRAGAARASKRPQ
jgi:hypothetical protein